MIGIFCSCLTLPPNYEKARTEPFMLGHSHNDYERENPLTDALALGFSSIEADVHLKNGQLYVAHDEEDINTSRTFESMYLKPLFRLAQANGGWIYQKHHTVTLFVDFKTDADSTYDALLAILPKYERLLSTFGKKGEKRRAVRIIISGERPIERMRGQEFRLAAVDGRLPDLPKNESTALMPIISDKWSDHFTWKGRGPFPDAEKKKLREIVRRSHSQGKLVRFWDTDVGNRELQYNMWRELIDAGVDLINTDFIEELFLFQEKYSGNK